MRSSGRTRAGLRRGQAVLLVIAAMAVSPVFAACGDDDDESAGASNGSPEQAAAGSAVDDAKKVVEMSDGKLVYSLAEEPSGPTDIEPYGDWRGPDEAPTAEKGMNVQIIACTTAAPGCLRAAEGAKEAAQALGWEAEIIDGKGTPQGFASAFDTALSRDADAVVGIAVPTPAVGNKLAEAKKAGVVTVAVGDQEPQSGPAYDGYVPFPMPLMDTLLAYAEIAYTGGESKSIVIEDRGDPALVQAAAQYRKILETCDGCEAIPKQWQVTDALDPTKAATIIRSALSQTPDATAVVLPYSVGLPAVAQAIESEGKDDVALLAKTGDEVGLEAVANGTSLYNAGSPPKWAGWAAVDQALRGLAGEDFLGPTETGLGTALFSKETVPADADIDSFDGLVDYRAKYREIWGVSG